MHKSRVVNLLSEDPCTTLIQCVISLLAEGSELDVTSLILQEKILDFCASHLHFVNSEPKILFSL